MDNPPRCDGTRCECDECVQVRLREREQIAEMRQMASNKAEGPGNNFARAWAAALLLMVDDSGPWIT